MGFFGFYFYGWLNGDCVVSIDIFFIFMFSQYDSDWAYNPSVWMTGLTRLIGLISRISRISQVS